MTPWSAPSAPSALAYKECPRSFVIDDLEDNNNQLINQSGRAGYWYTFADNKGTTVEPAAGGHFSPAMGGVNGSAYAARMTGKIASSGAPLFAGMGFSFTDPKGPYDASAFTGITFLARSAPGSARNVRLKVPDASTDPDGKHCTECYNDFGVDLTVTETWTRYTIAFDRMRQMEGWGAPRPPDIDKAQLFGVQWQVAQPGVSFDIWVDDVAFTGCP